MKKISIFLFLFCFQNLSSFEEVLISEKIDRSKNRIYKDMALVSNKEKIHFCLSLPLDVKKEIYTIIVMAGLETGRKNLQYIYDMGNYAFVGYEYPAVLKERPNIFNIFSLRKKTLGVPQEILNIVRWTRSKSWSKKDIIIAGFSFGAIFVPSIYHMAEDEEILLGPGIIAYGGADLYPLFYANLKGSNFKKTLKSYIASYFLKPLEPSLHLPYIKGDFLIINGIDDKKVPFSQAKKLQELTPEPKTIINLKTGHMSAKTTDLLKRINYISIKWLDERLK